jgi:hypothetical protein
MEKYVYTSHVKQKGWNNELYSGESVTVLDQGTSTVKRRLFCETSSWKIWQKGFIKHKVFLLLPSSLSLYGLLPPVGGLEPFKRDSTLSVPLSGIGGLSSGGERSKNPPT